MAASPSWKVYNAAKEYRAACKAIEEAAVLVAFLGDGATIRCEHSLVVWTEGAEDQSAGESYDHVAEVASRRLEERRGVVAKKRRSDAAVCPSRWHAYKCALPVGHEDLHATEGGATRWPDSADTRETVEAKRGGCTGGFITRALDGWGSGGQRP